MSASSGLSLLTFNTTVSRRFNVAGFPHRVQVVAVGNAMVSLTISHFAFLKSWNLLNNLALGIHSKESVGTRRRRLILYENLPTRAIGIHSQYSCRWILTLVRYPLPRGLQRARVTSRWPSRHC